MSYAEASIRGAAEPDGKNTVPIESVNITPEEVKSAIEHKPKSPELESSGEPSDKDKKVKKGTRKSIGAGDDDPCASAGILMGVLAAVATTVGLVQKKRNNAVITVEQGAMVGAGIVLITTGYYFYLTRGLNWKK